MSQSKGEEEDGLDERESRFKQTGNADDRRDKGGACASKCPPGLAVGQVLGFGPSEGVDTAQ